MSPSPGQNVLSSVSDEELWKRYVDGSDPAFDEVRRRYEEPLYRYLFLSLHDPSLAAQHLGRILCMIAAHRTPHQDFESLREWIYAVATQQACPAHAPDSDGLTDFVNELKEPEPKGRTERMLLQVGQMRRAIRQPLLLVADVGLSVAAAARACRLTRDQIVRNVETGFRRLGASDPFGEE
jgi:hypothetical protein